MRGCLKQGAPSCVFQGGEASIWPLWHNPDPWSVVSVSSSSSSSWPTFYCENPRAVLTKRILTHDRCKKWIKKCLQMQKSGDTHVEDTDKDVKRDCVDERRHRCLCLVKKITWSPQISAAELIRHFLALSAAPGCSSSHWMTQRMFMLCAGTLTLCCTCVKGELWVNPVANSLDSTRRSCLKCLDSVRTGFELGVTQVQVRFRRRFWGLWAGRVEKWQSSD